MSVKDRIMEFCKTNDIKPSRFERACSLSNGYLSKLRHEPSRDKLAGILEAYPTLSCDWLLTGRGAMHRSSATAADGSSEENMNAISTGRIIPYFDAEVAAGTAYEVEMTQTCTSGTIEIGGLMKDSEFALRVYGNSMTPNYPAGCVVGLKQHLDSFIEPGTVYVIETAENRYLKRLYNNKEKSAFRCISDNTMRHESGPMTGEYYYPEFEIPLSAVRRLLRVTGVIKRLIL